MSSLRAFVIGSVTSAVLLGSAVSARADGFISPFIGFNFSGDSSSCASLTSLTSCEDKRLNWGASFGAVSGIFGFEEEIAYSPQFFGKTPGTDNAMFTLMSNLMLVIPAGPIQPYGIIGLGLMRPHATFSTGNLSLEKNALGWDIGGGLNIFFSHAVGIRGDVRDRKSTRLNSSHR